MKKKLLSLLLAVAMMFSLAVTASAEETKGTMDGSIVILHTNDVHGAIGGNRRKPTGLFPPRWRPSRMPLRPRAPTSC